MVAHEETQTLVGRRLANRLGGAPVGSGNEVERRGYDQLDRNPIVVGSVQVVPEGYQVRIYLRENGQYVLEVNGRVVELHAWVGVSLETEASGKDWRRSEIGEYHPNDVLNYLKKLED